MTVRQYCPSDESEWLRMRMKLWPQSSFETHRAEMIGWLARSDAVVLVAPRAIGLSGFVEAGARSLADSCESTPVAYLEGWFVDRDMRRRGIGRALVAAAEAWARTRRFQELASDAELENFDSQMAHIALGFCEVDRLVHYLKKL